MSCCGNVPRVIKDDKWSCSECGAMIDENYDYSQLDFLTVIDAMDGKDKLDVKKCTCGSTSVGSDKHSYYCDLYRG